MRLCLNDRVWTLSFKINNSITFESKFQRVFNIKDFLHRMKKFLFLHSAFLYLRLSMFCIQNLSFWVFGFLDCFVFFHFSFLCFILFSVIFLYLNPCSLSSKFFFEYNYECFLFLFLSEFCRPSNFSFLKEKKSLYFDRKQT